MIEAYLRGEWRRATRLSLAYALPELPERVALVRAADRDRLERALASWELGRTWLYARWRDGGEELVALVPGLDLDRARELLERGAGDLAVCAGPETGGELVGVHPSGEPEPLGPLSREALPGAYARARGREGELQALYRPAQSFIQVMAEQAVRRTLGLPTGG